MKPILTLKKVPNPKVHNPYGFERIHILHFNIDGKGTAIVCHDDEKDLQMYHGEDLNCILFGEPCTGQIWYRPENVFEERNRSRANMAVRRRT